MTLLPWLIAKNLFLEAVPEAPVSWTVNFPFADVPLANVPIATLLSGAETCKVFVSTVKPAVIFKEESEETLLPEALIAPVTSSA